MEKTLLDNFRSVAKKYWKRYALGVLFVVFSNLFLIYNPLVFRQAVMTLDPVAAYHDTSTRFYLPFVHIFGAYKNSVWFWAAILLMVTSISSTLKYFMRVQFFWISREVEKEIRLKIFERLQNQSMAFYDKHSIGELISRLTNDMILYRDALGTMMYPFFLISLVIPAVIVMLMISPILTFGTLTPLLLIPLLFRLLQKHTYRISLEVQKSLAEMSTMTQEHYSGIRIIKSYCIENACFGLFKKLCKKFKEFNTKLICIQGLYIPFLTFTIRFVTLMLVLLTAFIILKGWEELSTADFLSFMWIESYVFVGVLMLGWMFPIFERGRAAYARIVEIYEEPLEVIDQGDPSLRIPLKGNIEIRDLSFSYPNTHKKVLNNINLNIAGGTLVGITGPTGGGKTTLFRLINRQYEVEKGHIFINQREIHEYPLDAFQQEIIAVEQVPFLFSKTLAENVRFGRQSATQEEIEFASQLADIHETILEFPRRYDTMVGERGVTLSGGQKQRIALARAFLVERSILLLDGIFSAVDAETEKKIFDEIKTNFSGKTILISTHRASILMQTDRVIYFQKGEIVEDDSPQELERKKGYFAALVGLQKNRLINQEID